MKRNRLLNSTYNDRLFSSEKPSHSKRRHILILSFLILVGVFLATMVLATSASVNTDIKSQVISLPGQTLTPAKIKSLEESEAAVTTKTLNTPQVDRVPVPVSETEASVEPANLSEVEAAEQYAIDNHQPPVTNDNAENATESTEQDAANNPEQQPVNNAALEWKDVTVQNGDNLSLIFPRAGLSARDVYNVAQTGDDIKPLLNLKPGQTLHFGLQQDPSGKPVLKELHLQLSPIEKLQLTATDKGFDVETLTREVDHQQTAVAGEIKSSLFAAGAEAGMSDKLIMELAHIFGWDVDFALDLRQGDNFKVVFDEAFLDGKKFDDGNILAAEFTNKGKTFRAVRYTDNEGNTHYYTPEGNSMRKTFTRTPVHFSRISSKFNPNRKHPILKTSRPHNGVDYAAPTGTPVLATGDAKVAFVGTKGGYGRTVVLSHGGKYSTLYAHLSKFKPGIKAGQRIRQGEVIAYVGMSGLATGPHLHYEFRVNGVHKNPLTVELPKAEPLNAKYMPDFKQKANPLIAELNATTLPVLAMNQH